MKSQIIFILVLTVLLYCCSTEDSYIPAPQGLLVELLREPEKAVITDSIPEFSWIFPAEGEYQSSYRILVSSTVELLDNNEADFWDSKKIESSKSINVNYAGSDLKENSNYFWMVKVWGSNNTVSRFSKSQQFNTGTFIRNNDEWPGQSHYIELQKDHWVSENRQTAEFHDKFPIEYDTSNVGKYLVDFGKAAFGTLEFSAESKINDVKVEVYLGERKNKDNTVNKKLGHSNIGFEKLEIILQEGVHNYSANIPKHHSKSPHTQKLAPFYPEVLPFRFVETNYDHNNVKIKGITQKALYYPFDDSASSFVTDNSNLNNVLDLCKYTLKATPFLGLYADGNRERMPYEADSYIQQLGHYSVDREYSIARYTNIFLLQHASWPTEWQIHTIFMAWEDYMYTGNLEFIKANYNTLKAKTLYALAREDGLISTKTDKVTDEFLKNINYDGSNFRDIVDWPKGTLIGRKQARNAGPLPEGERDGYEFLDYNTVVNSFHYRGLLLMSEMAKAIGEVSDYEKLETRARKVKSIFLKTFFDFEKGIFLDGEGASHSSLHANMFPLAFGLVPAENKESVVNFIKSKGMACSVYGAQYLLDGLYDAGESDYGLDLMTTEHKRSWINMLNVGSTMTTEAWDEYYKPNLTWNHAWGSAPVNVFVRKTLGIQPTKAGFETFTIIPKPGGLKKIEAKVPTIRGPIECNFHDTGQSWKVKVNVPGNSTAQLNLPGRFDKIEINGKELVPDTFKNNYGDTLKLVLLKPGISTVIAK